MPELGEAIVETPTKRTQISQEFSALEKAIEELHNRLTDLSQQLEPIREPKPKETCSDESKEIKLCPLANKIRQFRRQIDSAIYHLCSLKEEIEL